MDFSELVSPKMLTPGSFRLNAQREGGLFCTHEDASTSLFGCVCSSEGEASTYPDEIRACLGRTQGRHPGTWKTDFPSPSGSLKEKLTLLCRVFPSALGTLLVLIGLNWLVSPLVAFEHLRESQQLTGLLQKKYLLLECSPHIPLPPLIITRLFKLLKLEPGTAKHVLLQRAPQGAEGSLGFAPRPPPRPVLLLQASVRSGRPSAHRNSAGLLSWRAWITRLLPCLWLFS